MCVCVFLIFYNARHSEWAKTKNATAVSTDTNTSARTHTSTIGALENRPDAGKKPNASQTVCSQFDRMRLFRKVAKHSGWEWLWVSNVIHECINLRLTSLCVAILTHVLVVKLQYTCTISQSIHEICTLSLSLCLTRERVIHTKPGSQSQSCSAGNPCRKIRTYHFRIGCFSCVLLWLFVWYLFSCYASTHFHSEKVCFYAYLSFARIFSIKKLYRHTTWRHITPNIFDCPSIKVRVSLARSPLSFALAQPASQPASHPALFMWAITL